MIQRQVKINILDTGSGSLWQLQQHKVGLLLRTTNKKQQSPPGTT